MGEHMDGTSTKPEGSGETIELPAPTASPIVLAFGVALIFAGLATHGIVTGMGAVLALAGVVAWFKQVLPHPVHERVAPAGEVVAVSTSRREVEHVGVAANLVRANLPIEFYPISAGVRGGLAGGVAMAILAVLYGVVSGHGIWYPINLLVAGFFPSASIAELSAFHPSYFGIAVAIHAITSLLVGVLYGAMLPMLPRRPILLGGLIAPLLWTGLLYSSLALINPLLAAQVDWWWFAVSQFGYGIVAGLVVSRRQRVATAQPLPFSMRAGIEATGLADESTSKGQEHDE
jgi:hypothetical protein